VRLPHVELNERMAKDLGTENGHYDLISTHTNIVPLRQNTCVHWMNWSMTDELSDFVPRVLELCRFTNGTDQTHEKLMQLPRNFDARMLFYRADLIPPTNMGRGGADGPT
jgi:hypothetical protein